ncbi:MAG TPA: hypothetical protein VNL17_02610 [Verrucomicrobiae bacterium]|nr:hypothetical protein [Verrucomicrobiae bacterium]
MSDRRPLSKVQWVLVIVAVLAILFSLGKCSTSTTSPSHSVFSSPAVKSTSPWRQISAEQHEKMKVLLAPYAGSRIAMVTVVGDEESQAFGSQLDAIFREAGWQTEVQAAPSAGPMPSVFLRVPRSHIPESKVTEFSHSATDVTLTVADLPPSDLAVLKAFRVLGMDCPLETMDIPKEYVEVRIGTRP